MIELEGVRFSYEESAVLEGVSLTVDSGELVGLIGPNGAGKTTTLRLIAGFMAPDGGSIRVDGDRITELRSEAASRRLAVVPQATGLSFDFPVREVVAMGRHPHLGRFDREQPNDRDRVESALAATRTAELADRPFTSISGGERKRVLLARSIAQDAPNLLLDEPTASLDLNHQIDVFEQITELRDEGRTVIAAIHDLDLAARYCDRLALLAGGSLNAVGPPAQVLDAELLETAYGIETRVLTNPVTDSPMVVPHPSTRDRPTDEIQAR